jgi:hypothetical protein
VLAGCSYFEARGRIYEHEAGDRNRAAESRRIADAAPGTGSIEIDFPASRWSPILALHNGREGRRGRVYDPVGASVVDQASTLVIYSQVMMQRIVRGRTLANAHILRDICWH